MPATIFGNAAAALNLYQVLKKFYLPIQSYLHLVSVQVLLIGLQVRTLILMVRVVWLRLKSNNINSRHPIRKSLRAVIWCVALTWW